MLDRRGSRSTALPHGIASALAGLNCCNYPLVFSCPTSSSSFVFFISLLPPAEMGEWGAAEDLETHIARSAGGGPGAQPSPMASVQASGDVMGAGGVLDDVAETATGSAPGDIRKEPEARAGSAPGEIRKEAPVTTGPPRGLTGASYEVPLRCATLLCNPHQPHLAGNICSETSSLDSVCDFSVVVVCSTTVNISRPPPSQQYVWGMLQQVSWLVPPRRWLMLQGFMTGHYRVVKEE